MFVELRPWILLLFSVQEVCLQEYEYDYEDQSYEELQPLNCSTTETIKNGHVTYSQGGMEGSRLTYHCGPGQYPFPVSQRLCDSDGEWSTMRLANGRPVSLATCKDMLCPAQIQLDNGDFWPRDPWLPIGANQSFTCHDGFTLYGSAQRNCTLTGEWTGTAPICDKVGEDDGCHDPGIPTGAQRSRARFSVGERVTYQCLSGLDLLGSAERVCLENKEWSGTAPRCQGPHTFDSPMDVAAALGGSFAGLMDVLTQDSKQTGPRMGFSRSISVTEGSRLNIYILLDASGSILEQDFEKAKEAAVALIRKLDSYEVKMKFHVLSFASKAIDIVDITDIGISDNPDQVIMSLSDFERNSHGKETGTNLYAALERVNGIIGFLRENSVENHFNETQNVIILATDGYSNVGIDPKIALKRIRDLLGYRDKSDDQTDETLLDVYVFGIGEDVKKKQLDSLASKKRGEKHFFTLKDYKTLGKVFEEIISDKSVTMCGVARDQEDAKAKDINRPWHVKVIRQQMSCTGSLVSENWVLTAAHCFAKASTDVISDRVQIIYAGGEVELKKVIIHENYNTRALKDRNVAEFYDYDIALVQLNRKIPLSETARPICLPCTVPASRALKKVNSTCQQHREELLPNQETTAFFFHKMDTRKQTHIHTKSQRPGCVENARNVLKETDVTLEEFVPERFLCSGGSSSHRDAVSCKGDSGGSLFLQKRNRYFQVGVVSWGTVDACKTARMPPEARDFHIDLFKLTPWLRKHLGGDIQFLPDTE